VSERREEGSVARHCVRESVVGTGGNIAEEVYFAGDVGSVGRAAPGPPLAEGGPAEEELRRPRLGAAGHAGVPANRGSVIRSEVGGDTRRAAGRRLEVAERNEIAGLGEGRRDGVDVPVGLAEGQADHAARAAEHDFGSVPAGVVLVELFDRDAVPAAVVTRDVGRWEEGMNAVESTAGDPIFGGGALMELVARPGDAVEKIVDENLQEVGCVAGVAQGRGGDGRSEGRQKGSWRWGAGSLVPVVRASRRVTSCRHASVAVQK
jgi:hypothetical protein